MDENWNHKFESSRNLSAATLWHQDRDHHIHLVSIIHVCVGHNVVVALGVDVELVVIVVVVVEVVVDVGDDGQDVHGRGEEGHLSDTHRCCVRGCRTPENF